MTRTLVLSLACIAALAVAVVRPVHARETRNARPVPLRIQTVPPSEAFSLMPVPPEFATPADTIYLGQWDFNDFGCTDDGWTPHDETAQPFEAWHVDDFSGLGGGDFGRLVPLEGNQSMWVGARPDPADPVVCGYAALPGYGNNWNQRLCTKECLSVGTGARITFLVTWDSEPGYDGTSIEIDNCDGNWVRTSVPYYPPGQFESQYFDSLHVENIPDSLHGGSIRIRFNFISDGGFSDEDGLWPTDGAFIVDSLFVEDANGVVLPVELFEDEAVGATSSDDWVACARPGFSTGNTAGNYPDMFADLFPGLSLAQEDPCVSELDCMWAFIAGSEDNYACGGYPGQAAVPMGPDAEGLFFHESIWSPVVPFPASSDIEVAVHMYPDLPEDNLVYFNIQARGIYGGCPGYWRNRFGGETIPDRAWQWYVKSVEELLGSPGATGLQVSVHVVDGCGFYCGVFGSGDCHSHGPLIDEVKIYALDPVGPEISVRPGGLLSDGFPEDGTLTGTVRANVTVDLVALESEYDPWIVEGDSASFTVRDVVNGLSTGAIGGGPSPSVYAYVGVWPQGKYSGAQIEDASRWPIVDSTTSPAGDKWFIVLMDTSFSRGYYGGPIEDEYCFDLNDNLFVPGDTICYFVAAQSGDGKWAYYYDRLHATDVSVRTISSYPGATNDIAVAFANPLEMTCLPTQHLRPDPNGRKILYVDAADGRGVEPFFATAFDALGISADVDRFDVSFSGSSVQGHFGYRVKNGPAQINPVYDLIIWASGSLDQRTIGDGSFDPLKSDDFEVLHTFLHADPEGAGLYLSGDGVAAEWATLTGASATALGNLYMSYSVLSGSHRELGVGNNPLVIGAPGSCFEHAAVPDTMVAFGGCPVVRDFDVLTPTGAAAAEMYYADNAAWPAIVSQATENQAGDTARVVLSGFSYHLIASDQPGVVDRFEHLADILAWLGNAPPAPTGVTPTRFENTLAQNYPNPFNPTTTIEYALRERAAVELRVYNVAGQVVRTLVDGERAGGQTHAEVWDGRNDAGQAVASGVYFYRLRAGDFVQTRKMVLLK